MKMTEADQMQTLVEENFVVRIHEGDPTLWKSEDVHIKSISNRLGWVNAPQHFEQYLSEIEAFGKEVSGAGFTHIVLCGMGGSSLSSEVARFTFGSAEGYPKMIVLDNTSPEAIKSVEESIDLASTVFIVASKSGGTVETKSFYQYFYARAQNELTEPGSHFIAITDPGSKLEQEARDRNFRGVFLNPQDIGGRFSVLSYFGLIPMACMGIDVKLIMKYAQTMAQLCGPDQDPQSNPGLSLGNWLGYNALNGKNKLTLVFSDQLLSFAYWVEQLIAESTGKEGQGIVPITEEKRKLAHQYGDDRAFVFLFLNEEFDEAEQTFAQLLEDAGHPVYRIILPETYGIGGEFYCWEYATAVAGRVLNVNPFDEPNVAEAKSSTDGLISKWRESGQLSDDVATEKTDSFSTFGNGDIQNFSDLLNSISKGDYFSILVYFPKRDEYHAILSEIREKVGLKYQVATCLDYGPRYLHSTGQLHKGGPNQGVHLVLTSDPSEDFEIPGEDYSFNVLHMGKALGDFESLKAKDRRVLRIHIVGDIGKVISELELMIQ